MRRQFKRLFMGTVVCAVVAACGAVPHQTASVTAVPTNTPSPTPAPPTATATTVPPTATATATPVPTETPTPLPPTAVAEDVNDQPALNENNAPPTPEPEVQRDPNGPSEPVRIIIPAIGLDYQPVSVGLDENRIPVVPAHDVGWYNLSAMPGQGENVVFWGHVLRWQATPGIPAPFADVKYLEPGAEIYLYTADGDEFRYAVTEAVQVTPDQVEYVLPQGKEKVTLVSCIGDNVIVDGWLTKQYRLITIAEPVQ